MNKVTLLASAAIASFAVATPAFAQAGPFADVPADHWAYASVEKLQKEGIVIGYPDQTYGGKRAMTRYEFAVAIARLLDKLMGMGGTNLDNYYTKAEVDSRLAGLLTKEEGEQLRNLVNEFKNELSALGVDVDAIKKRLTELEGRVAAIERELKRVRITGAINLMARGNNRFSEGNRPSVRDRDGFLVTNYGGRGGIQDDSRVFHDLDLGIKARISDKTTAEAIINFGNYLDFLNSITSFSGARSDFSGGGILGTPGGIAPQRANQDQTQTIYKLSIDTSVKLPLLNNTSVSLGRIPVQFTPYTLRLIDVDSYFYNQKTDTGNIPVDGAQIGFNLGPVGFTVVGAKVDPIRFVSDNNKISPTFVNSNGGFGLYAGAGRPAYGGFNSANGGLRASNGRQNVVQNAIGPRNGAMPVDQFLGGRVVYASGFGTLGATFLTFGGSSPVRPGENPSISDPDPFGTTGNLQGSRNDFETVRVYGVDLNSSFKGIGIAASYTESETYGRRVNRNSGGVVTEVESELRRRTEDDNYAFDGALTFNLAQFGLQVGYRYIGAFFGAPGSFNRLGSQVNMTDIKGPYGRLTVPLPFLRGVTLVGEGQWYEGTDESVSEGGLTDEDEIQNYKLGFAYPLTSASSVDLGVEYTSYRILNDLNFPGNGGARVRPYEIFYNIGYGFSFNPNTSLKLLYQISDYNDKNSGFDPFVAKGGVAAAQFSVRF